MSSTRDYIDYLNAQTDIAPANSQEELEEAQLIQSLMDQHGLETHLQEFDARSTGDLPQAIALAALFIGIVLAGVTGTVVHYVGLVLVLICIVLFVVRFALGKNVLASVGGRARSQNVIGIHRAEGPLVTKGNRPIVIMAHYDTPNENFLYQEPLARYHLLMKRLAPQLAIVVFACAFIQLLGFLPDPARRVFWFVGIICAAPLLVLAISVIYERFAPCTDGANDNKSGVAALLGVMDDVRPGGDAAKDYAAAHPYVAPEPEPNEDVEPQDYEYVEEGAEEPAAAAEASPAPESAAAESEDVPTDDEAAQQPALNPDDTGIGYVPAGYDANGEPQSGHIDALYGTDDDQYGAPEEPAGALDSVKGFFSRIADRVRDRGGHADEPQYGDEAEYEDEGYEPETDSAQDDGQSGRKSLVSNHRGPAPTVASAPRGQQADWSHAHSEDDRYQYEDEEGLSEAEAADTDEPSYVRVQEGSVRAVRRTSAPVRHGAETIEELHMLPDDCEIVYRRPAHAKPAAAPATAEPAEPVTDDHVDAMTLDEPAAPQQTAHRHVPPTVPEVPSRQDVANEAETPVTDDEWQPEESFTDRLEDMGGSAAQSARGAWDGLKDRFNAWRERRAEEKAAAIEQAESERAELARADEARFQTRQANDQNQNAATAEQDEPPAEQAPSVPREVPTVKVVPHEAASDVAEPQGETPDYSDLAEGPDGSGQTEAIDTSSYDASARAQEPVEAEAQETAETTEYQNDYQPAETAWSESENEFEATSSQEPLDEPDDWQDIDEPVTETSDDETSSDIEQKDDTLTDMRPLATEEDWQEVQEPVRGFGLESPEMRRAAEHQFDEYLDAEYEVIAPEDEVPAHARNGSKASDDVMPDEPVQDMSSDDAAEPDYGPTDEVMEPEAVEYPDELAADLDDTAAAPATEDLDSTTSLGETSRLDALIDEEFSHVPTASESGTQETDLNDTLASDMDDADTDDTAGFTMPSVDEETAGSLDATGSLDDTAKQATHRLPNLSDKLVFSEEEDVSEEELSTKDTTGLDALPTDDVDVPAPEKPKPRPIDDPTWGKTDFNPSTNIGRRAALFDLPDPGESLDPFADEDDEPEEAVEPTYHAAVDTEPEADDLDEPTDHGAPISADTDSEESEEVSDSGSADLDDTQPDARPQADDDADKVSIGEAQPLTTITSSALQPTYISEPSYGQSRHQAKRKSGLKGFFAHRKKEESEPQEGSISEWLGVSEDYDAKKDGRSIGTWENFEREEERDDRRRDSRNDHGSDNSWKGGAAMRSGLRVVSDDDVPAEQIDEYGQIIRPEQPTEEEMRDQILHMGDDELISHDIYFVAVGSNGLGHAGARAFIDQFRHDIRGCFLINLDSVGAGELTLITKEGIENPRRADRRLVRMLSNVFDDLHIPYTRRNYEGLTTDATYAMQDRVRAVTLMGQTPDGIAAQSHVGSDEPEAVDRDQTAAVTEAVSELIRRS